MKWKNWNVGDTVLWHFKDFDGEGSLIGSVTDKNEERLLVEADGETLWVDDSTESDFTNLTEEPDGMEIGNILFGNSRGEYRVERDAAQHYFNKMFSLMGLDGYGFPNKDSLISRYQTDNEDLEEIDTELFTIRPYYWGDDEDIAKLPNFVFKPEKIEIKWYKYPMRDAYSNVKLSEDKIKEIVRRCTEWYESVEKA